MTKIVERALDKGAEAADVFSLDRQIEEVDFSYNKLESVTTKNLFGQSIRVIHNGKVGQVSTSNQEKVDDAVAMALEAATFGDPLPYPLPSPQSLPQLQLVNDNLWKSTVEQYIAAGERLVNNVLEYEPKATVGMRFTRQREEKSYQNSGGCDNTTLKDMFSLGVEAQLIQDNSMLEVQTLYQGNRDEYDIDRLSEEIIEKLRIGRVETPLSPGKMPVVLSPYAVAEALVPLVVGMSGEFVRQGVSPLKGRLNQQILSEKITIIDDMLLAGGFDSAAMDDEGMPAERTKLFANGVLQAYLLSLKSAHELGLRPNGKAARQGFLKPKDHSTAPQPHPSNLLISPGATSLSDMIADIEEGLLIHDMSGLIMGNLIKGDIDSDIDLAFKIKNGKVVGRVKDAAIGANFYNLFKEKVVELENRTYTTNFIGFSMELPHILLKDVNIVI